MDMNPLKIALTILLTAIGFSIDAQQIYTQAGNTCSGATQLFSKEDVCVTSTLNGYFSNVNDNDTPSCFRSGKISQATFIKFLVTDSGMLNFTITPDNPNQEIDWALYSLELGGCTTKAGRTRTLIACNFYQNQQVGSAGLQTGMSPTGTPTDVSPFIKELSLKRDSTYLLMVDNFINGATDPNSGKGYCITWGGQFKVDYDYFVPNAFSPNFDGVNDEFQATGRGIDLYAFDLSIYSRWGKLVFQTADPFESWNGGIGNDKDHMVLRGVYGYVMRYSNIEGQSFIKKGTIVVLP